MIHLGLNQVYSSMQIWFRCLNLVVGSNYTRIVMAGIYQPEESLTCRFLKKFLHTSMFSLDNYGNNNVTLFLHVDDSIVK